MYKVFIKDKVISFVNSQENLDSSLDHYLLLDYDESISFRSLVDLLFKDTKLQRVILVSDHIDECFNACLSELNIIDAAGGVVQNNRQEYLFIYRLDKWDLPKGKIEKGEGIETAAIREVEEECAVEGLKITKQLPSSYHIYHIHNEPVVKRTYWFAMDTNYDGELIPQTEEGIEAVKWMDAATVKEEALKNTYESIADFLATVFRS